MLNLDQLKDVAEIVGGAIALVTLVRSLVEYTKRGAQDRAARFEELRIRFKSDPMFRKICDLLESDSPELRKVPFKEKRDFIGFFEEIALIVNTGLMKKAVAHYMFGYYALRCWDSQNFWSDVNRDSPYWALFEHFTRQMQEIERNFHFNSKSYKF